MVEKVDKLKCSKCQQEVEVTKIVPFAGKLECYKCWELGINKEKVKELREQLTPYIESDATKLKKGLNAEELKRVRQIITDNYFGESNKKSKEIINAIVFMDEKRRGESVDKFLERINQEIKLLELKKPHATKPRKYTLDCPVCGKKFSYEPEQSEKSSFTSKKEADEILNEQVDEHIEKTHKVVESKNKKLPSPSEEKSKDKNSSQQQDSRNKSPLPLLIGGIIALLLISSGIITYLLWNKNKK